MGTVVALLRGVNVGKAKRIAMPELRAALEQAGVTGVRTLLASGNVVLDDPGGEREAVAAVQGVLRSSFGMDVDVVVRTSQQLAEVVASDPLAGVADDGSRRLTVFLSAPPTAAAVRSLPPAEGFAPETWVLQGRELHLWCPGGLRDSTLANQRWSGLGVVGTARNWNTVLKLHALAGGTAGGG